jgi:hypothetical protein
MSDSQLKRVCKDFRDGILNGRPPNMFCFMVCAALQGYLAASGIETKLIEGEIDLSHELVAQHFWLERNDGAIIDPTSDQFATLKLPAVYMGIKPEFYRILP